MPSPDSQPFLREFLYHITMGLLFKPREVPLTPLRLATEQLEEAKLDLLRHAHLAEFHAGTVTTLKARILRLGTDIAKLAGEKEAAK